MWTIHLSYFDSLGSTLEPSRHCCIYDCLLNRMNVTNECRNKIIISSIFIIFQLLNLTFGLLVTCKLYWIYKTSEMKKSFCRFLTNLLFAIMSYVFTFFIGTSPQIFTCSAIFGSSGVIILGAFCIGTFMPLATNIMLISLNRYFAICWPQLNKVIFKDKYILPYCIVAWLTGPTFIILNYLIGCYTKFNESSLSFALICASPNTIPALSPHSIYLYICAYGTLILYALCIRKLRKQAAATVAENVAALMSKKQMHVFWQALFIWLSFVTTITTYRVLPFISNAFVKFGVNLVFIFCCLYATPIVIVCFSKRIRQDLSTSLFNRNVDQIVGIAAITNLVSKKILRTEVWGPGSVVGSN